VENEAPVFLNNQLKETRYSAHEYAPRTCFPQAGNVAFTRVSVSFFSCLPQLRSLRATAASLAETVRGFLFGIGASAVSRAGNQISLLNMVNESLNRHGIRCICALSTEASACFFRIGGRAPSPAHKKKAAGAWPTAP
jgi:hypothetical protein